MSVITSQEQLKHILSESRNQKKIIVFTNGVFDILHRGHIEYLTEAKKLGDILIIGVNSDRSVKEIKGESRPLNNENDRAFILSNIIPVDYTIIFDESDPYNLIKAVQPDVLVKGGDWKPEDIIGSDIVLAKGGKVISLRFTEGYSTTGLIKKIVNN